MNNNRFNQFVQVFLAVAITVGFFGVIALLMLRGDIPPTVKDILLVMLGALLASWKELTGYYYGSSSASSGKDQTIADQAKTAQINASPTVPAAPVRIDDTTPIKVQESPTP